MVKFCLIVFLTNCPWPSPALLPLPSCPSVHILFYPHYFFVAYDLDLFSPLQKTFSVNKHLSNSVLLNRLQRDSFTSNEPL